MARKSRFSVENKPEKAEKNYYQAGAYTRLSIEDEMEGESGSIGNQKKMIMNYLEDKADIDLIEIYTDDGFSGMNYQRPGYQRMIEDARKGKINCVIVKDISRLGRDFLMTSEIVEKFFPGLNIRLICINDDYDSANPNSDASAMLLPFKMIMNDSYVRDVSCKIRSSIKAKMDHGEFLPSSSSVPYGYLRNPTDNTYDIDEETGPVVKMIFEMKARGTSINEIVRYLNEKAYPSPGRLRWIRGMTKKPCFETAVWSRVTVRKILQDQVYIGNRVHCKMKRDRLGSKKEIKPKEAWKIVPGAHVPLVSKEIFELAGKHIDETRAKIKEFVSHDPPEENYKSVLAGKLFCGDCGYRMISIKVLRRADDNGKRKSYVGYECSRYDSSAKVECTTHYILERDIIEAVKNALNAQIKIAIDMEKLIDDIQKMPKVAARQSRAEMNAQSVLRRKKNIEAKLERLITDLTEQMISREEYVYAKEKYKNEYEQLLLLEEEANKEAAQYKCIVRKSKEWIKQMKEYDRLPEINREVVDYLVERIDVFTGKRIKIHLKYQNIYEEVRAFIKKIDEEEE